jgi:hypothetical protein
METSYFRLGETGDELGTDANPQKRATTERWKTIAPFLHQSLSFSSSAFLFLFSSRLASDHHYRRYRRVCDPPIDTSSNKAISILAE